MLNNQKLICIVFWGWLSSFKIVCKVWIKISFLWDCSTFTADLFLKIWWKRDSQPGSYSMWSCSIAHFGSTNFALPPPRHVHQGLSVLRPRSEDPHLRQWKLVLAECIRQHNKVAIKLCIISPPLSFSAICSEQTWALIGWWLSASTSQMSYGTA